MAGTGVEHVKSGDVAQVGEKVYNVDFACFIERN